MRAGQLVLREEVRRKPRATGLTSDREGEDEEPPEVLLPDIAVFVLPLDPAQVN